VLSICPQQKGSQQFEEGQLRVKYRTRRIQILENGTYPSGSGSTILSNYKAIDDSQCFGTGS